MPLPPPRKAATTSRSAVVARATSPSKVKASGSECLLAALPDSQIKELKAAFLLLDKNQDGRVNAAEIKHMLDNLGILLNDAMIQKLVAQASGRDDGLISEDEFLAWMAAQTSIKDDVMEDLLAAFRVFDKDANGYITKDELKLAMEMIGEPMSEAQLDSMIRATDIDNDGRINYEEFVTILL
uniref:Putative calmodulin n=1 Tax=Hyalomma excavatum TaxID=257692 RepID=A0A131XFW7_9ACAR